jgi:hypothetical protein
MPLKQGTRDFILYIVIGVGLVTIGTLWMFVVPERYWLHLNHTWFSFIFFTGLLLIVLAKMYWPVRQNLKIWFLLIVFLAAHFACYVLFLEYVREWPAFWYLLTMPIEVMIFAAITHKFADVLPKKITL